MLVYMAAHGLISAANRPGTAAQAQPNVNNHATEATCRGNFSKGSHHFDTCICL
jgi:hypothetical protein